MLNNIKQFLLTTVAVMIGCYIALNMFNKFYW